MDLHSTDAVGPEDGPEDADAAEARLHVTHFYFTHLVFQAPGARFFLRGPQHVPTFRVDMGDLHGLVDIAALKKEFGLAPECHDAQLLDLVIQGLRYVPDIKPGDTIPSELLDGSASWTVGAKHRKIAEQRLQVQLLSWVTGKEVLLTDANEIAMFLEQIENREKLRNAFRDAAVALGHQPENTEPVMRLLGQLARELSYIEALRDRFNMIPKIGDKLVTLAKSLGSDRNAKMELMRVQALLRTGIASYTAIFTDADAQTSEIIAAMKSLDRQMRYIRQVRDKLHFLMMQWDPYVKDLDRWQARRSPETDKLLTALYRFLAPRFTAGRSILKSRAAAEKTPAGKPRTKAAQTGPTQPHT